MAKDLVYLQDKLDRELAWRKKEIAAIRRAATRKSPSQGYYCRAGTVLLCAHWEGFLKSSIERYVSYVFSQGLELKKLSFRFVAIAFFNPVLEASKASHPGSQNHHLALARKIRDLGPLSSEWNVSTGGNPGSEVLGRILSSVGIDPHLGKDPTDWAVAKQFIDSHILSERHKVAHGHGVQIAAHEFRDRAARLIALCDELSRLVMGAAEQKTYLAVNEPA